MKVVFYSDVHFSRYSSILRKQGSIYSYRLDNCIDSVGWAEAYAESIGAELIVIGGDFFDRSDLTAEELTAFKDIYFSQSIPHAVLVGNHEIKTRDRQLSSAHIFETVRGNFTIVDEPVFHNGKNLGLKYNSLYLPYLPEDERLKISDYIASNGLPTIVYSHNDIAGIQMGNYMSKEGFDIEDIKKWSSLFVNGHLHNGLFLDPDKTICNVGNLTGQNFSEDGYRYKHGLAVIDTDAMTINIVENPYAVYFYKLEFKDNVSDNDLNNALNSIKHPACLTVKACLTDSQRIKDALDKIYTVVNYRVISNNETLKSEVKQIAELKSIDHIEEFKRYVKSQLEPSELLDKELQEIL